MKLWSTMRWRSPCITNATKRPWRRYNSAVSSMRDAKGREFSNARNPAVAEPIEAEPAQDDGTTRIARNKASSTKSRPRWTLAEKKILIEALNAGVPNLLIPEKLPGRTLSSVMGMIERHIHEGSAILHAQKPRPWTSEERSTMMQLVQAGVTPKDARPQFPGRSNASVDQNYGVCKRDPLGWINGNPRRTKMWTAADKERLRELIAQKTPIPVIAESLQRTVTSVSKAATLGFPPPPGTWWTPERDAELSRLRSEGRNHGEIAVHLGTSFSNVTVRWHEIKPRVAPLSARSIRNFQLTLSATQVSDIEASREKGMTWDAILAKDFPFVVRETLMSAYRKHKGIITTTKRRISPTLEMSDADIEDIERLRKRGTIWPRIAELKYPGRSLSSVWTQFAKEKKVRSGELTRWKKRKAPPLISFADLEDIERLQKEGLTFSRIVRLKYPDKDPPQVLRAIEKYKKACSGE